LNKRKLDTYAELIVDFLYDHPLNAKELDFLINSLEQLYRRDDEG